MKTILVSGWSFGRRVLEGIQRDETVYLAWQEILADPAVLTGEVSRSGECLLCGWSLGAFLLHGCLSMPQVKGAVLCAIAGSFCRSDVNPYGTEDRIIKKMIAALTEDTAGVLGTFADRAALPAELNSRELQEKIPVNTLKLGLEYLLDTRPAADKSDSAKTVLVHGREDSIIDIRGAGQLAAERGYRLKEVKDAGHLLPYTHAELINEELAAL